MYFWRIEQLKDELATSPLSDRESLHYLLTYVVATTLPFWPTEDKVTVWDQLTQTTGLLFAVLGTIHAYRENGGTTGQQFLQRYLALGWVLTIRWGAGVMIAGIVAFPFWSMHSGDPDDEARFFFAFWLVAMPWYWRRLGIHFRSVANRLAPPPAQT